jgi:hypothetical protein
MVRELAGLVDRQVSVLGYAKTFIASASRGKS